MHKKLQEKRDLVDMDAFLHHVHIHQALFPRLVQYIRLNLLPVDYSRLFIYTLYIYPT